MGNGFSLFLGNGLSPNSVWLLRKDWERKGTKLWKRKAFIQVSLIELYGLVGVGS